MLARHAAHEHSRAEVKQEKVVVALLELCKRRVASAMCSFGDIWGEMQH